MRREFRRKLSHEGIWATAIGSGRWLARRIVSTVGADATRQNPFDVQYGTETGGTIEPGALDVADEIAMHAVRYQTAIIDVFLDILHSPDIPHSEYVFIDLGSGKGRALLLASQLPFDEIIGVEASPRLHDIACRNIEVYHDPGQQCRRISSVCSDAARFDFPDRPLFIYMFNPFDEKMLQVVVDNLFRSWTASAQKIIMAYLKPVHRQVLDEAGFLTPAKETERYMIYESKANCAATEDGRAFS